ncbi:MAG TPA: S8 family serine peptidase [Nitrosopumilaceae archaeon]|nr:S8 family serine peptidase [Nitrosopumilaceae archaeon]
MSGIKPINKKSSLALIVTAILVMSITVLPVNIAYSIQDDKPKHVPGRLLVKFNDGISVDVQNWILGKQGVEIETSMTQINTQVLKVPENAIIKMKSKLEKINGVEYVETDSIIEPTIMPNDKDFPKQWHLSKINAASAWDVSRGNSETIIAVIDTGFDLDHPDLADKFTVGYNVLTGSSDVLPHPCGHGTKTAGITAAMTNNDLGVAGMGWNNKILPIKVIGDRCWSTTSALAYAVIYAADHGAKVANLSWEINDGDRTITNAAKYMNRAGGVVIASSGNSGQEIKSRDNPSIISVGATRQDDSLASFSSRGNYVDFTAPGFNIWTTCICVRDIITNSTGTYYITDYYGSASGTSFSAPIVSGIAGLIYSEQPNITPKGVYEILKKSAIDLGVSGYDTSFGWGRIDASKALQIIQSQQIQIQQVPVEEPKSTEQPGQSSESGSAGYNTTAELVEEEQGKEKQAHENKSENSEKHNNGSKSSGNSGSSKKSKK